MMLATARLSGDALTEGFPLEVEGENTVRDRYQHNATSFYSQ